MRESNHPITRICITGGPCAGKTTAMATLSQHLTQMGFRVLQVPETINILKKGGLMTQQKKMSVRDAVQF